MTDKKDNRSQEEEKGDAGRTDRDATERGMRTESQGDVERGSLSQSRSGSRQTQGIGGTDRTEPGANENKGAAGRQSPGQPSGSNNPSTRQSGGIGATEDRDRDRQGSSGNPGAPNREGQQQGGQSGTNKTGTGSNSGGSSSNPGSSGASKSGGQGGTGGQSNQGGRTGGR